MVVFNQFYSAMDRIYDMDSALTAPQPNDSSLRPGQTIIAGRGQGSFLNSLNAAIRRGAKTVEMQFSSQEEEPLGGAAEGYGKEFRQTMKEVQKAAGIKVNSVHAPADAIGNLSGLGKGGFKDEERERIVNEVKKAVEFAADVTHGGSIVVHTGEYPRPISQAGFSNRREQIGSNDYAQFRGFREEIGKEGDPGKAMFYFANSRTGEVTAIAKNEKFHIPMRRKDQPYLELDGRKIPLYERDSQDRVMVETLNFNQMVDRSRNELKEEGDPNWQKYPAELAVFKAMNKQQLEAAEGDSYRFSREIDNEEKALKKVIETKKIYQDLKNSVSADEWKKLKFPSHNIDAMGLIPVDEKKRDPLEYLTDLEKSYSHALHSSQSIVASQMLNIERIKTAMDEIKPIQEVALEKTSKSLSELGIYAMKKTQEKGLEKPLFIAPENIFPDFGYGSHPDELIKIVVDARKTMAQDLKRIYGFSDEEASKRARDHIKATFDTQHLGMWRRYFEPKDQKESVEKTNERFRKWYLQQVEKLMTAEKKYGEFGREVLGNIHAVDGMGLGHTHLPLGQGMNPIKDALKYLVDNGYAGNINLEGAAEGQERLLYKAWQHLGSPIYSTSIAPVSFRQVHEQATGYNAPPFYVVGAYSPINTPDWQFWSEVPLE